METEQELLDAIRSGERTAWRRLYERYSGYTMAIAQRYIPACDDVHDVMQDSFVKILTTIGEFDYRGEGSLKNWVSRIVANKAIDYIRQKERINFVATIPDEPDEEVPEMEDIPPDILYALIKRLPANYRLVLNLFVFEQRSHKEIARLLGIKENSSASIFLRAKKMLGKMVRDYLNEQTI
ncbi:MAG: sigma-70 family RNA polymerase sigma factor [Prevotella sp.]|nr:sigma-70 family RNA polymerase sigma factor [Prevotella sp.]